VVLKQVKQFSRKEKWQKLKQAQSTLLRRNKFHVLAFMPKQRLQSLRLQNCIRKNIVVKEGNTISVNNHTSPVGGVFLYNLILNFYLSCLKRFM